MNETELKSLIDDKLRTSINESSSLETDSYDALKVYNGEAYGNEMEGRSSFVTRDVMEQVEWAMPSLMKVFASGTRFVQFEAQGPDDETQAEHETDVINYLFRKSEGWQVFHDWFKTALIHKVGYVKVYYGEDTEVNTETVTVSESQLPELTEAKDIEILSQDETEEVYLDEMGQRQFVTVYALEVRKTTKKQKLCVDVIPNEEMRVSKNTKSINLDEADFVAHEAEMTVSDCLERGWPKSVIEEAAGDTEDDFYRSAYEDGLDSQADMSQRLVKVAECYLDVDMDDNGISEYRRVIKIGDHIVENDPWGECPFEAITPIPMPHQHVGNSLVDLVEDVQKAKSDLFRQVIDNLRLTNNPEREVVANQVVRHDELFVSMPGHNIQVRAPGTINPLTVPFTAGSSVPILGLLDQMKEARTGISRHTMGLDPDALAQSTKGAFMGAMNQANQRIEMIARNFAETGVKGLFRKIHSLVVDNVKESMNIKLGREWGEANPSQWHKRKDLVVNVGLGNGNKDEQVSRLVQLAEKQVELMNTGLPLVTPKNIYNTLSRIIEAADLKEPTLFFTDPDSVPPKEPEGPSIQEQLAQAQIELAKFQAQNEQAKIQLEAQKLEEQSKDKKREFVAKEQEVALKAREIELKENQNNDTQVELEKYKADLDASTKLEVKRMDLKGKGVDPDYNHVEAVIGTVQEMQNALALLVQEMNRPKKVVRDELGNLIGVE